MPNKGTEEPLMVKINEKPRKSVLEEFIVENQATLTYSKKENTSQIVDVFGVIS